MFVIFGILWVVCCDVGILYEVWHLHASMAMKQVAQKGGVQLTTEKVIRSNGKKTLNDVYEIYGVNGDIWNVKPKLGFYCIYRHRDNETHPPSADCDNITETLSNHAKLLVDAGIDYVTVDITNWPVYNRETDMTVVRPTEVLFEEWLKLRENGIKTPLISIWPCSPNGSTTWKILLDTLYNDPKYDDLVYKRDGKKIVFIPARPGQCQDDSVEAEIRSNGGRNDIETVDMWAIFDKKYYYEKQWWGFFSPCVSSSSNKYTTSIVGTSKCDQPVTEKKKFMRDPEIIEISASASYMLSQTSLPFASPGKLRGLTMQKLFEKILDLKPPHVFISSFNEHIGGRQKSAYSKTNIGFNQGLPKDPQRDLVWVDTYGYEFSRDVEPTEEGGDNIVFDIMSSCVKMYKNGQDCQQFPSSLCCETKGTDIFANIYSLEAPGGSDYLLTNDVNEKKELVDKRGWKEICNPIDGPSVFCVDRSISDGRAGPFILYSTPQPNTIPLYRCYISSAGKHFFSTSKGECELYTLESVLGYISVNRGNEMLRGLHRCLGPREGTHIHALDLECDKKDAGLLGFVR